MARTATRIGALLRFLKVLVIHPEPAGNEQAIWQDTTVSPLEDLVKLMEVGLGAPVELRRLGTTDFHGHIYTAALLQKQQ
jgi:hypothetical protein